MALPAFLRGPIRNLLREAGFRHDRSDEFSVERPDVVAGIEFVATDSKGPKTQSRATANIWVRSRRLAEVFDSRLSVARFIGSERGHWHRNAAFVSELERFGRHGTWWVIDERDSELRELARKVPEFGDSLCSLDEALRDIGELLVSLERRSSDGKLIDEWVTYRDVWIDEAHQTAFLAVLLAGQGRDDEADSAVRKLHDLATSGDDAARDLLGNLRRT